MVGRDKETLKRHLLELRHLAQAIRRNMSARSSYQYNGSSRVAPGVRCGNTNNNNSSGSTIPNGVPRGPSVRRTDSHVGSSSSHHGRKTGPMKATAGMSTVTRSPMSPTATVQPTVLPPRMDTLDKKLTMGYGTPSMNGVRVRSGRHRSGSVTSSSSSPSPTSARSAQFPVETKSAEKWQNGTVKTTIPSVNATRERHWSSSDTSSPSAAKPRLPRADKWQNGTMKSDFTMGSFTPVARSHSGQRRRSASVSGTSAIGDSFAGSAENKRMLAKRESQSPPSYKHPPICNRTSAHGLENLSQGVASPTPRERRRLEKESAQSVSSTSSQQYHSNRPSTPTRPSTPARNASSLMAEPLAWREPTRPSTPTRNTSSLMAELPAWREPPRRDSPSGLRRAGSSPSIVNMFDDFSLTDKLAYHRLSTENIAGVARESSALKSYSPTSLSDSPTGQTVSSRPTGQTVSSRPTGQTVSSRPTGQTVSSRPTGQTVSSRPTGQTVSSRPTGQTVSSPPTGQTASSRPTGQTALSHHGTMNRGDSLTSLCGSPTGQISSSRPIGQTSGRHSPSFMNRRNSVDSHTTIYGSGSPTGQSGSRTSQTETPARRYTMPTSSSFQSGIPSYLMNDTGVVGLQNLGNTCFMNSMLQCLSHTPEMTDIFLRMRPTNSKPIATAYKDLMNKMWMDSFRYVNPMALKNRFSREHPQFSGYQQQDAQEFLRFLVTSLHDELVEKPTDSSSRPSTPRSMSPSEKGDRQWKSYKSYDSSPVGDLFTGQLRSTLKCCVCKNTSYTFDPFWDLQLPFPKKPKGSRIRRILDKIKLLRKRLTNNQWTPPERKSVQLRDCLKEYTQKETLDNEDKAICHHCNKVQKSVKRLTIERFPPILALHLKRFTTQPFGTRKKLDMPVNIPQNINVGEFSSDRKDKNQNYELYAVSNHTGSVYCGHYTAWIKHHESGQWYTCNDSSVSKHTTLQQTSEPTFTSSEAYVLFYRKVNNSSTK